MATPESLLHFLNDFAMVASVAGAGLYGVYFLVRHPEIARLGRLSYFAVAIAEAIAMAERARVPSMPGLYLVVLLGLFGGLELVYQASGPGFLIGVAAVFAASMSYWLHGPQASKMGAVALYWAAWRDVGATTGAAVITIALAVAPRRSSRRMGAPSAVLDPEAVLRVMCRIATPAFVAAAAAGVLVATRAVSLSAWSWGRCGALGVIAIAAFAWLLGGGRSRVALAIQWLGLVAFAFAGRMG